MNTINILDYLPLATKEWLLLKALLKEIYEAYNHSGSFDNRRDTLSPTFISHTRRRDGKR
jgi:hypothetical protein